MSTRVPILVVGGGYAGAHAAVAARRHGIRPTIVDRTGRHAFLTRLAAVAAGTAPAGDADTDLAELTGADVVRGDVVEAGDGYVVLEDGRRIDADAVILTVGAEPTRPEVPGLLDHAQPLRTERDALRLRDLLESAEGVVVIGAGATGVQLAGALRSSHRSTLTHLVDRESAVLATFSPALGRRAESVLRARGVELHLGVDVAEIRTDGVVLANGRELDGVPVWAGGFESRGDELLDADVVSGRLVVDESMLVHGRERTFAAGDVAAHRDRRGRLRPMSAQIAVQAGRAAGANAVRFVESRSLRAARLMDLGWVVDLGGGKGVAELGPVPLAVPGADRFVPTLHTLIDLRNLYEVGGLQAVARDAPGRSLTGRASQLLRAPLGRPRVLA